jgi:hypothetical protein
MKQTLRLFLSLITISVLLSCCDMNLSGSDSTGFQAGIQGESSIIMPSPNLSEWRARASTIVNHNFNETGQFIGKIYNTHGYINLDRLSLNNVSTLNADFNIPGLSPYSFAINLAANLPAITDDSSPISMATINPGITTYFNTTQINILNKYFNTMLMATNPLAAHSCYLSAKASVDQELRLSWERKIAIMAIVELGNEYAKQFFAGSTNGIYVDVLDETGLASQSSGCTIRWRDVWRSGVWAGVGGAVVGGVVGATAGSFVVPILGTATGGVGGAVFGFAAGFVSGSVGSAAQQVFWNCLLKSPTSTPNPACSDPVYFSQNFEYCTTDSDYSHLRWYLLDGL